MATPNQVHPVSENPINVPVGTKMNTLSSKVVDNGRRIVSGALAGLALAVSSPVIAEESRSDGVVVAQAMTPNPEYDRIISEAKAAGKDPVDYLDEV